MANKLETRNRAIAADLARGRSLTAVAEAYGLSPRTVRSIRSQYAAPVPKSDAVMDTRELGLSGLDWRSQYVYEEFLRDLNTARKRVKVYNEMRLNSPVIASALSAIELSIRRVNWRVDGEDGDERVLFVEECLDDMSHSWSDHVIEALTMLAFGWSFFEIVYKRRSGPDAEAPSAYADGRIGWRKLAMRGQDSLDGWQFDESGGLQAMVQRPAPDYRERVIPIQKALLYRTSREKNNPEGRSLLRSAYTSYYYAKQLQTIEAIGIERDLAGLPMVVGREGATMAPGSDDYNTALNLVRRVRNDEEAGVVLPHGWQFELVGSSGGKSYDASAVIARYETRMAQALLAQFIMLGLNGVGSYALSSDQSDFFVMAVSAFADLIADTFNSYAIPRLLRLNGMSLDKPPQLAHDPLGTPDLAGLATYFSQLAMAGFIRPDADMERWLRDMVDAPPLTDEEIERRQAAPPVPTAQPVTTARFAVESPPAKWRDDDAPLQLPSAEITEDDIAKALADMARTMQLTDARLQELRDAEAGTHAGD